MYLALLIFFLLISVSLITIIMLQQGKCSDISSSLNTGLSGTLFSTSNSVSFMTRITSLLAALFFILNLILGNLSIRHAHNKYLERHLNKTQQTKKVSIATSINRIDDIPQ